MLALDQRQADFSSQWKLVWEAEDYPLQIEQTQIISERCFYRVNTGSNSYAGAVAVVIARDTRQIVLVQQKRIAVDLSLWELVRGVAEETDKSPIDTAVRETIEETGVIASELNKNSSTFLGFVYPDSGLLHSKVAVVKIEVPTPFSLEPIDREVTRSKWFHPDEIDTLIRKGELRDGISLSALSICKIFAQS